MYRILFSIGLLGGWFAGPVCLGQAGDSTQQRFPDIHPIAPRSVWSLWPDPTVVPLADSNARRSIVSTPFVPPPRWAGSPEPVYSLGLSMHGFPEELKAGIPSLPSPASQYGTWVTGREAVARHKAPESDWIKPTGYLAAYSGSPVLEMDADSRNRLMMMSFATKWVEKSNEIPFYKRSLAVAGKAASSGDFRTSGGYLPNTGLQAGGMQVLGQLNGKKAGEFQASLAGEYQQQGLYTGFFPPAQRLSDTFARRTDPQLRQELQRVQGDFLWRPSGKQAPSAVYQGSVEALHTHLGQAVSQLIRRKQELTVNAKDNSLTLSEERLALKAGPWMMQGYHLISLSGMADHRSGERWVHTLRGTARYLHADSLQKSRLLPQIEAVSTFNCGKKVWMRAAGMVQLRPPGPEELLANGVNYRQGVFLKGDVGLKHETKAGTLITLRRNGIKGPNVTCNLSALYVNHFLYARPIGWQETGIGRLPGFAWRQTPHALLYGIRVAVDNTLSWHRWHYWAGFNLTRGRDLVAKTSLPYIQPDHVFGGISYDCKARSAEGLSLSLSSGYWFSRPRPEGYTQEALPPFRGYASLNASILWAHNIGIRKVRRFELECRANNLLGSTYRVYLSTMRYFADQPGRNISIVLTLTL